MSMPKFSIILASESPRRRELFSLLSGHYTCVVSDVDERSATAADAPSLCLSLARLKCKAVFALYPDSTVIGCDTVVEIGGDIIGKPTDTAQARTMMQRLSGQTHRVYTGVYIKCPDGENSFVCASSVEFFPISADDIETYIATDEPYDKAGGYGIQGAAAKFIKGIEGDYFNVMGLPISRLYNMLSEMALL